MYRHCLFNRLKRTDRNLEKRRKYTRVHELTYCYYDWIEMDATVAISSCGIWKIQSAREMPLKFKSARDSLKETSGIILVDLVKSNFQIIETIELNVFNYEMKKRKEMGNVLPLSRPPQWLRSFSFLSMSWNYLFPVNLLIHFVIWIKMCRTWLSLNVWKTCLFLFTNHFST